MVDQTGNRINRHRPYTTQLNITIINEMRFRRSCDNWQRFCGERDPDPDSSIDYTVPVVVVNNVDNETIYDYFGLPTKIAADYEVSALPFRAYNLIWNSWFRDENLQESVDVNKGDADELQATFKLLKRGKRHDYFTSCLPWLQRGDAVTLSLGTEAPVLGIGKQTQVYTAGPHNRYETGTYTGTVSFAKSQNINGSMNDTNFNVEEHPDHPGYPYIRADLANATASTVNELRQAIQVQRILERDARSGTRYTEIVESHFGVISPDARLQRPEYLGGGSSPVHITPIARTDTSPGKLAAIGTTAFSNHGFTKSFTEHGVVIGLVNVRADLTYQEGIEHIFHCHLCFFLLLIRSRC